MKFFILSIIVFAAMPVYAATLYFRAEKLNVSVEIDALIPINAVSAGILIPKPFSPEDINEGNSIINLWVDKPSWDEKTRLLTFSGIIPGGFSGTAGRLLLINLKTEGDAVPKLEFDKTKTKVFLNTPDATEDKLEFAGEKQGLLSSEADVYPPEDFTPQISRDPNIFDNNYFLVFSTQDKNSGIAGYFVREGVSEWVPAESPYELKDQKLRSYIYVRAVDKAGNERIASLPPQNPLKWYENYLFWIIIIVIGSLFYYGFKKYKKRN
jgi:hypothetical protein